MNNDFLRREWGAVGFVIITALGLVIVPVALSLNKQATHAPAVTLVSSPSPSEAPSSPSPSAAASPSSSPAGSPASPSPSPAASPSPATPSPTPS